MVDEKDAQAAALGYVSDASKVDKAKFKNYVAGSHCGSCALFQGKADAASGPCPLFPGKQVATTTDTYVKENPWRSIAVAAGVGLLVGVILGRK